MDGKKPQGRAAGRIKVLVCIKQVRDPEAPLVLREDGSVDLESGASRFMNRFDEFAIEEALGMKDAGLAECVHAVTVGPERSGQAIRRAMEMGADSGTRIDFPGDFSSGPWPVSGLLAGFARKGSYDLILTGVISEDDMQGAVGQMTAEILGIPCAASVVLAELDPGKGTLYVEREIESGRRECLELALPALIAVQSGINRPRYPSLSNVLRAGKEKINTADPEEFGIIPAREILVGMNRPGSTRDPVFLDGRTREKAARLWDILHERSLI
ncbi:MAG: electron transfer flavoprotein subunit beta/FixA family protein [Spirochaetes bacterium]|jgi:electron transfer flavoprotein beta subunit|nr:electron transfer flavoprotein subunit beta/FixA family protein [Spirochaetota bacterium]